MINLVGVFQIYSLKTKQKNQESFLDSSSDFKGFMFLIFSIIIDFYTVIAFLKGLYPFE